MKFASFINKHVGKEFLIYCPGKNIDKFKDAVDKFVKERDPIIIGSNKIKGLIVPTYHLFLNNDKFNHYRNMVDDRSVLMLGRYIRRRLLPSKYVKIHYTDRDELETLWYDKKKDVIHGYYRTSGNLAIMMAHLMGAEKVYVAGMSGFTYEFDGNTHYYDAELDKSDFKPEEVWFEKYDQPTIRCLDKLKDYGIDFKLITPTIYEDHFDGTIL